MANMAKDVRGLRVSHNCDDTLSVMQSHNRLLNDGLVDHTRYCSQSLIDVVPSNTPSTSMRSFHDINPVSNPV